MTGILPSYMRDSLQDFFRAIAAMAPPLVVYKLNLLLRRTYQPTPSLAPLQCHKLGHLVSPYRLKAAQESLPQGVSLSQRSLSHPHPRRSQRLSTALRLPSPQVPVLSNLVATLIC